MKVRPTLTVKIKLLVCIMLFTTSVIADSTDVMRAQFELGHAMTKLGLLTNSFTDKGMESPNTAGALAASDMTASLDKFIASALQKNATCDHIQEIADKKIAGLYENEKEDFGLAAKKAVGEVKAATRNYVSVQCINLTE
ncbi:hypothetical protein AB6T85_00975 [Erwinia sp. ACCC 02193]|uniref:Uncharacterized protein n=1 Tax=Erwinia aeris TaxID=3239803 RepID=A0ABV4E2A2_9GAMM